MTSTPIDVNRRAPATLADNLGRAAAENLSGSSGPRRGDGAEEDWTAAPGLERMLAYLETKTVSGTRPAPRSAVTFPLRPQEDTGICPGMSYAGRTGGAGCAR